MCKCKSIRRQVLARLEEGFLFFRATNDSLKLWGRGRPVCLPPFRANAQVWTNTRVRPYVITVNRNGSRYGQTTSLRRRCEFPQRLRQLIGRIRFENEVVGPGTFTFLAHIAARGDDDGRAGDPGIRPDPA